MKRNKLLMISIIVFILPLSGFTQVGGNYSKGIFDSYKNYYIKNSEVRDAINFVNDKFRYGNEYGVQFRIDESKKILITKSTYYEVVYPLATVEKFIFENKLIKVYCYSYHSGCITSIDIGNGSRSSNNSWSLNLNVDETTGKEVVEKLELIKTILGGTDYYLGTNSTIKNSLNIINNLFSQYNDYHFSWWVDGNKKLKFRSDYYEGIVDPYKLTDITYSNKIVTLTGNYGCVQEYSIGSGNNLSSSSNRTINFDSDANGTYVVNELKKVVNELGGKLSISGGSAGTYTYSSGDNYSKGIFDYYKYKTPSNSKIREALNYVNSQMNVYNGYNMDFRVDENKKIFVAKSDYYEIVFPIAKLERITYSNKIVSFKCYDFCGECITNISNSDGSIDMDATRTVDLKVDDATGRKVIEKLEEIKTLLAGTDFYLGTNSTIKNSLNIINNLFSQYNNYHFSWWVDGNKKLKFRSDYYEGIVDPYKLTDITYSNKIVTLTGNYGCVQEYSIGSGNNLSSSSNRTINFDSDANGTYVVNELKKVVNELGGNLGVTGNFNYTDNTTPPTVSSNQKIRESLDFINMQFKKYNQYGVQFRVDEYNKTLISKSNYFEVTYPMSSISAFESATGLIKFNCSYGKCIKSRDLETNKVTEYNSYAVNFDGNEAIAEVVLKAFETIKAELK